MRIERFLSTTWSGLACAWLAVMWPACLAQGASDPAQRQAQLFERLDALREAGFRAPKIVRDRPPYVEVEAALADNNRALMAAHDWRRAALGLIRQGKARGLVAGNEAQLGVVELAVQAAMKSGDPAVMSNALSERSRVEVSLSRLGQAALDARQALHLAENAADRDLQAKALSALSKAQLRQGELFAAVESSQRALALAEQSSDGMALFWALQDRTDAYVAVAELCRVQTTFDDCSKSLDVAEADVHRATDIAAAHRYAALVDMERLQADIVTAGRAEIASRRETNEVATMRWPNARSASDVIVLERLVPKEGYIQGPLIAQVRARLADSVARHAESPQFTDPDFFFARGFLSAQDGDHGAAADWYLKAAAALDRDRRSISDAQARTGFIGSRLQIYQFAAMELLDQKRYAEAFDMTERSRSRVLSDMIASRPPVFGDARTQALFVEAVTLRQRIAAEQAAVFETAGARAGDAKAVVPPAEALRADEAAYDRLLTRMAAEAPALASLGASPGGDLAALQRAMREDGFEVLQYMLTPMGLVIWHLGATGSTVRSVLTSRGHVVRTMKLLADSLRDPSQPFDDASARELYYLLIEPIRAQLSGQRLVVLPFEGHAEFPFQALVDPSDARFLGERVEITYAPSATVLLALKKTRTPGQARALALGDPDLPGAPVEIASIAGVFARRGVFNADELPAESDVKARVAGADVVHLAVHGYFDAAEPMRSYLQLGAGSGEDGRLTATEMFGLRLSRGPLVVLSACETGVVETTASGETLGMARGLLYAGANALLLSQWRVDSDATSRWMQSFYQSATTMPLPRAAKLASDRLRADPATRHPYYWAPFLLTAR